MSTHSFKILNASAGAGKTFALVKEYLLLILSSDKPTIFQHILALTFTNKAVAEMKGRILEMLWAMAFEPDSEAAMCETLRQIRVFIYEFKIHLFNKCTIRLI